MKTLKALGGAVVVGGLLGVLGQVFAVLFTTLGIPGMFNTPLVLIAMGVVGCSLYIVGIYPKIEQIGGFGAMLPFSGFDAALAATTSAAKKGGGSTAQSATTGVCMFLKVATAGILISIVVGLLSAFVL